MEYQNSNQILTELKSGTYRRIYVLHGEEAFFIDEVVDYVENHILTDSEKAFNQIVLYGKDVEPRQIFDEARQFPMMSERRVIIIKEAQDIKNLSEIEGYMKAPSPHSIVVLAHKNKKVDGRIAWFKEAKKSPHMAVLTAEPIKDYHLAAWVKSYLSSTKRKISDQANLLLCEYLGSDLKKLVNEINKLELNIPPNKAIEVEDIEKYVGISKEYNIFELNRCLGKRDVERAFKICKNLTDNINKSPVQMMLPAMFNHFQKAHIVHRESRRNDDELGSILKVQKFMLNDYKVAATNYSEASLRKIIQLLKTADAKSKGVDQRRFDPEELMKELVSEILFLS
jgi:DNA polymerase III subunit delta